MPEFFANIGMNNGSAEVRIGDKRVWVPGRTSPDTKSASPIELIMAALGSWMILTISAAAEAKNINMAKNEVNIRFQIESSPRRASSYDVEIDLGPGLTQRERRLLYTVARTCEVHKVLAGEATFHFNLKGD